MFEIKEGDVWRDEMMMVIYCAVCVASISMLVLIAALGDEFLAIF